MDYLKIYNQIVDRGENRKLDGYKEKHHIVPRCMGGDNSAGNIVELTAREHFLCHMLLCEIYPKNYKLKHSLFLMMIGKQKVKERHYVIGSRVYERLKIEYSKMLTGLKQSQETREKKSKKMKEVFASKPREEILARNKKISQANSGRKITWGEEIKQSLLGRKMPWRTKVVSQYTLDGEFVRDWESTASIQRDPRYGFVGACTRGVQKTCYGYIWKHKK